MIPHMASSAAICAWLACAAAACAPAQQPEPPPRPTEDLVQELVSDDPAVAVAAQVELFHRGTSVAARLGRVVVEGWPDDSRDEIGRGAATRILMDLGPRGVPAIGTLLACTRDPDLPGFAVDDAMFALIRIAPYATGEDRDRCHALFEEASRSFDGFRPEFDRRCLQLFSSLAVDGAGATSGELLEHLDTANPYAIVTACRALAARRDEFRGERREVVARLQEFLKQPFPDAFWFWRSGRFEQNRRLGTAEIVWLRTEASLALAAYAPDDERTLLAICQRLFDMDPAVRVAAARELGRRRTPDAARWLADAARDADPDVALAALDALVRIGPPARHVLWRLDPPVSHPDPRVTATIRVVQRTLAPELETHPIRSRLEILSSGVPNGSGVRLDEERRRLIVWLDRNGGSNRFALEDDVRAIEAFQAMSADAGGPESRSMRWVPVRVLPDERRPGHWSDGLARTLYGIVRAAPEGTIGPNGERLRPAPWVVELIPAAHGHSIARDQIRALDRGWPSSDAYSFNVREAATEAMAALCKDVQSGSGMFLYLIDGLAVDVQPGGPFSLTKPDTGCFTLRPGSEDRRGALQAMLDR